MGRVPWSGDEDRKLCDYIERNGGEPSSWENVPRDAGLSWRTAKGCKERYRYKLRNNINREAFSEEEIATIIRLQKQYGNKWEEIARLMPGRTALKIKNFWKALQKKLSKEDTHVSPRNPVGIAFGPASIPNASSIPAPVSASLEPSKADQVVEIVEVTPADQEIANRYPSTSTTFEHCDDLGSEGIPVDILFNWSPPDTSVDSIYN